MVLDPLRTNELNSAIHKVVKKGDVVCDIGAGLGLLSYFALSAGAKFVYAIDCDNESLSLAADHARKHGLSDKIAFIEGHSADVHLPEKVDVIICETIGSAAFDENILAALSDAKKRFLKPGGKIIPSTVELWGAPTTFPSPPVGEGRGEGDIGIQTSSVRANNLLCEPQRLAQINTTGKFGSKNHLRHTFKIQKSGKFRGMAIWPKIEWAKGFATDASPLKPLTHWKQCVLPDKKRMVKAGDCLKFELIIRPNIANPKEQTEILWKIVPSFVRRGKGR